MIEHTYKRHTIEQRSGLFYVPALRQSFNSEALAHEAIDRYIAVGEAVIRANESQDRYYRSIGGRDPEPTYRAGWKERYQQVLRESPE